MSKYEHFRQGWLRNMCLWYTKKSFYFLTLELNCFSVHLWFSIYWLDPQNFNDFGQGHSKGCEVMDITAAKVIPNPRSHSFSYTHVLNSNTYLQGFPDASELKRVLMWTKYSLPDTSKILNPHHWGFFPHKSFFIKYDLSNLHSHSV